jgi:competence ComEA-like helix-hairpin-helix protein
VTPLLAGLAVPATAGPSLNDATAEALEGLPMVGPEKARLWVEWRAAHGPCERLEDLVEVPGFGPATVAALRGIATCAPAPPGEDALPVAPRARVLTPVPVDVNVASAAELTALPGITPGRAAAIVALRERSGPFASCEDLVLVPGIGEGTVANLRTGPHPPICVAR